MASQVYTDVRICQFVQFNIRSFCMPIKQFKKKKKFPLNMLPTVVISKMRKGPVATNLTKMTQLHPTCHPTILLSLICSQLHSFNKELCNTYYGPGTIHLCSPLYCKQKNHAWPSRPRTRNFLQMRTQVEKTSTVHTVRETGGILTWS